MITDSLISEVSLHSGPALGSSAVLPLGHTHLLVLLLHAAAAGVYVLAPQLRSLLLEAPRRVRHARLGHASELSALFLLLFALRSADLSGKDMRRLVLKEPDDPLSVVPGVYP